MLQTCKPDPVLSSEALAKEDVLSFICPANYLPGSICLPIGIERAVLRRRPTWHFSMQGLPANDVTIKSRELLPHVFIFSSLLR